MTDPDEGTGAGRNDLRDADHQSKYNSGSIGWRSRRSSKWQCGPLAFPLEPTSAMMKVLPVCIAAITSYAVLVFGHLLAGFSSRSPLW